MAKLIRSLDEVRLDVFEAMKRAYIKRGLIPRFRQSNPTPGNSESQEKDDSEKLEELTAKSHEVLYEAKTFSLFPDTIKLDREKLTIANRAFFRVAKIISVPVSAMLSAEADVGPIFGSMHMSSKYFVQQNPFSVNYLWRHDAIKMQRLLQGYIIAHEHKIDCSRMDKKELVSKLNDLGHGPTD